MSEASTVVANDAIINGAIIAAFVSVALWCLTRLLNYRKAKRSLIRCLYAEVEYNIESLKKFRDGRENILGDIELLKSKLEDGLIPLAIFSDHAAIYNRNIPQLHYLKDSTIQKLLAFYGSFGDFRALSNGFVCLVSRRFRLKDRFTS